MNISDRVKAFKADLQNEDKSKKFNILAFVFSSFYFLYLGMPWHFILFAILPFIIMLPFTILSALGIGFVVGFIISHIIAGFIAEDSYRKYKENYVKLYEHVNTNLEVEYFAISLPRLIISTIITGGFYTIYWGFKNWNNYQKTTHDDVSPYLRGWFFNWTAISLFAKIRATTKDKKSYTPYGLACLLIFIADMAVSYFISKNLVSGEIGILILFTLMLIYPFSIVPVQIAINKYTTEKQKKSLDRHFYPWEIVFLILGVMINFYNWFGNPFVENKTYFTDEEANKIGTSVGFIYRHTEGYPAVCKHEGYTMTEYPNQFNNLFSQEISSLVSALTAKGYTFEKAKQELVSAQLDTIMKESIYDELEQLRKIWILNAISEEYNIPVENMEWQEDFDSVLTLRDACEIFDANGIDFLKNGENRYFLKANAL